MDAALQTRMHKIDGLAAQIRSSADPGLRDAALELVQTIMDFHAAAIDRMMEIASEAGDEGWRIIDQFGRDERVSSMLLLHGLHPVELEDRVRQALDSVRPLLRSHGGNVELLEIRGGAVRLRLVGSCHGCPSSALTLKSAIEKAIYEAAPDVVAVDCEGAAEAAVIL